MDASAAEAKDAGPTDRPLDRTVPDGPSSDVSEAGARDAGADLFPETDCHLPPITRKDRIFTAENLQNCTDDQLLTLKFREGSGIRLREGRLVQLADKIECSFEATDVTRVLDFINQNANHKAPGFPGTEEEKERREEMLARRGEYAPDTNLWYLIRFPARSIDAFARLINELNAYVLVDTVDCDRKLAPARARRPSEGAH